MPTHAEIAGQLLTDAAGFFKNMAEQNKEIRDQMQENAKVFEQIAGLLLQDPTGRIDDRTYGEMAGQLMNDAAQFFRALGDQNAPIKEQMDQNADIYTQIGQKVSKDPLGVME